MIRALPARSGAATFALAVVLLGEPLHLEQRLGGVAFMDYEGSQACDAGYSDYEGLRGCPTGLGGLSDRVDDRTEARGDKDRAAEVKTAPIRLVRVGRYDLERGHGEHGGDRKIDVKDHPPVGDLGQQAADENADRGASTADRCPGGERFRPLWAVERCRDDREGGR